MFSIRISNLLYFSLVSVLFLVNRYFALIAMAVYSFSMMIPIGDDPIVSTDYGICLALLTSIPIIDVSIFKLLHEIPESFIWKSLNSHPYMVLIVLSVVTVLLAEGMLVLRYVSQFKVNAKYRSGAANFRVYAVYNNDKRILGLLLFLWVAHLAIMSVILEVQEGDLGLHESGLGLAITLFFMTDPLTTKKTYVSLRFVSLLLSLSSAYFSQPPVVLANPSA